MVRRTYGNVGVTVENFESVKDWGANGDGATDVTAEFNVAISKLAATGGIILVNDGDHIIASPAGLTTGGRELYWLLAGTVNGVFNPALPGTIINSGVSDGSVTTAKIANNAVTGAKIAMGGDAQGDLLMYGGTDYELLVPGTSGFFLKSQGPGNDLIWAATSGSEPSDGDKGDITVASSGTAWTIDAGAVDATALASSAVETAKIAANAVTGAKIAMGSDAQGDLLMYGGTDYERLAPGTSGLFLKSAGPGNDLVWAANVSTVSDATNLTATTSGTAIDITGLAAGANRIEIIFHGVSTDGSSEPEIQIGDSGGIEASGYVADASDGGGTQSSTTGFITARNISASKAQSGVLVLSRQTGNVWLASGTISEGGVTASCAGSKTLSAELDRIRLTTPGGSAFDAGNIAIRVE